MENPMSITTTTTAIDQSETITTTITTTTTIDVEERYIEKDLSVIKEFIQKVSENLSRYNTSKREIIPICASCDTYGFITSSLVSTLEDSGRIKLKLTPVKVRKKGQVIDFTDSNYYEEDEIEENSLFDRRAIKLFQEQAWNLYSNARDRLLASGLKLDNPQTENSQKDDFKRDFLRSKAHGFSMDFILPSDILVWATWFNESEETVVYTSQSISPIAESFEDNHQPVSLLGLLASTGCQAYLDAGLDGIFLIDEMDNGKFIHYDLEDSIEFWCQKWGCGEVYREPTLQYLDMAIHHCLTNRFIDDVEIISPETPPQAFLIETNSDGTAHRYMDYAMIEMFFDWDDCVALKNLKVGGLYSLTVSADKVNFRTKEGRNLSTITSVKRLY